jgi:predicted nucleic acid-binding protein
MARAGDFQIWTSTLTLVEVYKHRMSPQAGGALAADKDQAFEAFLLQDFVYEVQLDREIALRARRLLRENLQLKKPQDAIHLATALINNLDEFHTFDGVNLIPLSLRVPRNDGVPLLIREPPPPIIGKQADLFVAPPQSAPPAQ